MYAFIREDEGILNYTSKLYARGVLSMKIYLVNTLKDLKKPIVRFVLATLIIMTVTFIASMIFQASFSALLEITDTKGIGEAAEPFDKFIQYVVNNGVKVPLQMFIFALIPIPFLYYLPMALTAAMTSFALYLPLSADLQGKMSFIEAALAIVPHAVIEFAGFIIWCAVLYRLNIVVRHKIFRRKDSNGKIGEALKMCGAVYLLCFAILVLGAGIESFITPLFG